MSKMTEGAVGAEPVQADPLRLAFEKHHLSLLRLCVLLSGQREDAEDIVQEAFIRSARKLPELTDEAVGPYLRAAAVNLWKNRLRRARMERRVRPSSARPELPQAAGEWDDVWRAVKRLPPRRRACVVLRFYEDMSEAETARVLGCSVGTVKSQTSRALLSLRKELGDEP
jgi:RNA polymerase sigma-70 factor (sigma-E family)